MADDSLPGQSESLACDDGPGKLKLFMPGWKSSGLLAATHCAVAVNRFGPIRQVRTNRRIDHAT